QWSPATKVQRKDDEESPGGRRSQMQSTAAREVGIGLLGGALLRDPQTGQRFNTALFFDASGELLASYQKSHIPEEPGFWETSHYEGGNQLPALVCYNGAQIGAQICSDANRPEGSHILGGLGAHVIVVPRATEQKTYERWKLVLRANAL